MLLRVERVRLLGWSGGLLERMFGRIDKVFGVVVWMSSG